MATETHPQPKAPALRELAARGLVEQCSDLEALDAMLASGPTTFYLGIDPTADSLHVGHLVPLMAARCLQRHGHRPILVVGAGTAMIGDPSGKAETRQLLDAAAIATNVRALMGQLGRFVELGAGGAVLLDNASWLGELRVLEFLRDIGRHFTVNRMLTAKTYRDRLAADLPLSFIEFNYQLLQAYDFLVLFERHGCRLQIGGADQWGNMIAGVELTRRVAAARGERTAPPPAVECLTMPLLTTAEGRKMGKTERGALWLAPERVAPFEYYQYWVNLDDRDVPRALGTFTDLPLDEIARLARLEGAELRAAKAALARAATAIAHGARAAAEAERASAQAFGAGEDWSAVPAVTVPHAEAPTLLDLVVHPAVAGFKSKREARTRIEDGAVRLDGEVVRAPTAPLAPGAPLKLQVGKRLRRRVEWST